MKNDKKYYNTILNYFGWTFNGTSWISPDNKKHYKRPYYAIKMIAQQLIQKYNIYNISHNILDVADCLLSNRGWKWISIRLTNGWKSNWKSPDCNKEILHTEVALALSEIELDNQL